MNPTRRIVLTGCSRGLGRAMTESFVALGHVVHGCSRSESMIAEMRHAQKPPHTFHAVDVTDDAQVARWADELLAAAGPPDLLVNNAAIINRNSPLWKVPASDFDELMRVNVCGVANVIRHFVPAMVAAKRGVIVNFSSGWGRSVSPEVAPYCATKFAIEGLTRALAEELPGGMAAVPLNPGIIDTDMLRRCFGDEAGSYPAPSEWAKRAVPLLLSLGPKDNGMSLSVE